MAASATWWRTLGPSAGKDVAGRCQGFVRELLLKGAWEAASAERGMWQVPRDCVFTGQEMVPINILQIDSLNVLPVSPSLGEFPQK